jgi:hypothetical protein
MTVEHKNLTGTSLHEPKGVAAATVGKVYVADGVGSGTWQKIQDSSIDPGGATTSKVLMSDGTNASWQYPDTVETGWSDMFGGFTSAKLTGSNQPTWTKVTDDGAGSTGIYAYAFSASALNELWIAFHVNHDYKQGTAFYPHIHWLPSTTNTGTVRWGIEWSAASRSGTTLGGAEAFGNTTYTYIEQTGSGTALQHQVAEVADPGITITGAEADMLILARVFRDAAHANDTFTGTALGLQLDAHFQIDKHATPNKSSPFI